MFAEISEKACESDLSRVRKLCKIFPLTLSLSPRGRGDFSSLTWGEDKGEGAPNRKTLIKVMCTDFQSSAE